MDFPIRGVSGESNLIFSPEDLISLYFYGIDLSADDGSVLNDENLTFHLENSQAAIENELSLRLTPQVYEEQLSYYRGDILKWGYIPTSFPVEEALALSGHLAANQTVEYPAEWLRERSPGASQYLERKLYIIPDPLVIGAAGSGLVILATGGPHVGFFRWKNVPWYWDVRYCTGFDPVPPDIRSVVGKTAAIPILNQLGDIIIGAGIASQSLGLDGLSQSVSTTSSAENSGYSARIKQYQNELKKEMKDLKSVYQGIPFTMA